MAQSSPPTPAMARPAASAPGMRVCEFFGGKVQAKIKLLHGPRCCRTPHACASTCVGDLCRAFLRELRSFCIFLRRVDFLCYICASSRFGASLEAVGCEVLRKFGFLLLPLKSCVKVESFADKAACSKLVKKLSVLFVIE